MFGSTHADPKHTIAKSTESGNGDWYHSLSLPLCAYSGTLAEHLKKAVINMHPSFKNVTSAELVYKNRC